MSENNDIEQLKIEVAVLRDICMFLCLNTFRDRRLATKFLEKFCGPVQGLTRGDPLKVALEKCRSDFAERFESAINQ